MYLSGPLFVGYNAYRRVWPYPHTERRRGNPPTGGWLPALRPKAFGRYAEGGHKGRPYKAIFSLWTVDC